MSYACHIHLHVILFFIITRFWDWIWRKKSNHSIDICWWNFNDSIYLVQSENWKTFFDARTSAKWPMCCQYRTGMQEGNLRFWEKHPNFIALQPSVVTYPRKLKTLISATLQLHISDFIFWSQDISTYRCGSFKKAKWWVPNKCRVTYSPWQKQ